MVLGFILGVGFSIADVEDVPTEWGVLMCIDLLETLFFGPICIYYGILVGSIHTILRSEELERRAQKQDLDRKFEQRRGEPKFDLINLEPNS